MIAPLREGQGGSSSGDSVSRHFDGSEAKSDDEHAFFDHSRARVQVFPRVIAASPRVVRLIPHEVRPLPAQVWSLPTQGQRGRFAPCTQWLTGHALFPCRVRLIPRGVRRCTRGARLLPRAVRPCPRVPASPPARASNVPARDNTCSTRPSISAASPLHLSRFG
jgi:hypothetical protein